MGFGITFSNVLLTLAYILPGFLLCKVKKASAEHLTSMSAFLIYACSPCMIISAFMNFEFSVTQLTNMGLFFASSLVLQAAFMLVLFALFRKKYADAKYRILTIASVMGNVGFFGMPLVKALLPDNPEALCYSSIYVISMNILVFTVGIFCLTGDKRSMTLKAAIFNPSMAGLAIGLPVYIFGIGKLVPAIATNAVSLLGSMSTPLCMAILGIRLATVSLPKLFSRPMIYLISLGKLVLFPLFCYGVVYFLPLPWSLKASLLILSATPCASIIFNMAELHKSETELAANCVLVTTLLSCLTLPLITMIL
jgi:predicted permease